MTRTGIKSLARTAAVTAVVGAALFGSVGLAGAETYTTTDEAYLTKLAEGDIQVTDESKAIILAYAICSEFDSGSDIYDVAGELADTDLTDHQKGFLIGAAIVNYCPGHIDQIPQ